MTTEPMKVKDLIEMLDMIDMARGDVDPPMTDDEWRQTPVVVRGIDEGGGGFCGYLFSVDMEAGCNETDSLVLDASNEAMLGDADWKARARERVASVLDARAGFAVKYLDDDQRVALLDSIVNAVMRSSVTS